ncbi:hypothetical protein [Amycolatopsis sp. ATCC 39116]|uniref:hypothetical protein n=1 Tax=Amycolatopsis sp. (strain ATCC 39116 / 75iv2) TaxID=385957 RepID=UPI001F248237|nr:hypothetical protein [Amycolatopsis sp. ATCC 39116]
MTSLQPADVPRYIRDQFGERDVDVVDVQVRAYPDETNYIVYVDESQIASAAEIGNSLDQAISAAVGNAFIVVRRASQEQVEARLRPLSDGVQDNRATELTRLISARSRVSEAQPSLAYVRDARANLSAVTAGRHHLIFGRRGAGKSALLVETKRVVSDAGALTCWANMQTLRNESAHRAFLHVLDEILAVVVSAQQQRRADSVVSLQASSLYEEVTDLIAQSGSEYERVVRLIPRVQKLLSRFQEQNALDVYVFVDDFYYLARQDQPLFLDMLHGCVRDTRTWLKIASIRHLTRWFQASPPLGLQNIHDADIIDLDVTLQEPKRAKEFLESILHQYSRKVGVSSLARLFHAKALDRLVLASGAVPRDYLVLASNAIKKAQVRPNAKLVGAQDVNQAAGDATQAKIQELEEDMASNVDIATRTLEALRRLRKFCLDETSYTYFLVSHRSKEDDPRRYNTLTDLLDVRLIHLIDASVSDSHTAGQRYEAFMLDLSQFSGARLKQKIQVLDFVGGRIVSHKTRSSEKRKIGDSPLQVISILRNAPTLDLGILPAEVD